MKYPYDLTIEAKFELKKFINQKCKEPEEWDLEATVDELLLSESLHLEIASHLTKSGRPEIIKFNENEVFFKNLED